MRSRERGARVREREREGKERKRERASETENRGMLGRFRRDRVHAEWSTAVCVRPRSSEDAPACSREGWTTLVATASSRHRVPSRCRHVIARTREDRGVREKRRCRWNQQTSINCHNDDHGLNRPFDSGTRRVPGQDYNW